MKCYS